MTKWINSNLLLLLFIGLTFCVLVGCSPADKAGKGESANWYTEQKQLYYGIPVLVSFSPRNERLAAKVWAYLEDIDRVFNDYKENSEIGVINNQIVKDTIELSPELAQAFRMAFAMHELTKGAFDITIKPLRNLWKKAEEDNQQPTSDEITQCLHSCGLDKVRLKGNHLSTHSPDLRFDFGGIIKGIAVDHAVSMLRKNGIKSAMIQIGGETAVFGNSMREKPYTIGIQHPEDLTQLWTAIRDPGHGLSISTSGNYRNPITINGKEFYHIVDPRTGKPVDIHVLSISIVFPTTGKNGYADGLATACAVIGAEKSIAMIAELGGEALILLKKNNSILEIKTDNWDTISVDPDADEL